MEKHKAIPHGYMTVGEVAKKMDVTVRTLQHYDREGLLSPSAISEGGRRLYTDKDIVKLHQILSLFIRPPQKDQHPCEKNTLPIPVQHKHWQVIVFLAI